MTVSASRREGSAAAVILALFLGAAPALSEEVDLELVIATDVSRSVNEEEALLQREGVALAFQSAEVIRAIEMGALGKIGVTYVDWSTEYMNKVVVPWTVVSDRTSAEAFAQALMQAPPNWGQRTSISGVLVLASALLDENTLEGTRRVVDISGDGPNNYGLSLAPVREETLRKGIVINGLPIIVDGTDTSGRGFFPNVDEYYRNCVIGGSGAFLIVARGFTDFADAMRRKLVLEISSLPGWEPFGFAAPILIPASAAPGDTRLPVPHIPAPDRNGQQCDRWGEGFGTPFGTP
jgi:hypothetical protein